MEEKKKAGFAVFPIGEKAWRVEENGVRCLLFEGDEKALLVDTGFGSCGSLKEAIEQLTEKPVLLVNTHADPDHTGCNHEFGPAHMHPSDFPLYHKAHPGAPVEPVWDGDVLDIGGRQFEVIHIPGHTPGSIALLDRDSRLLISGDSVSFSPIFMFSDDRSVTAFRESLKRLQKRVDSFDVIIASHGEPEVPVGQIETLITAAGKLLAGELTGAEPPFPLPAKVFSYNGAAFFYNMPEERKEGED